MWFFVVILGGVAGLLDDDWPPAEAAIFLFFLAVVLLRQTRPGRLSSAAGVGILAYLYTNVYLALLFEQSLPESLSGQTLKVEGEIIQVLRRSESYQQFRFNVESCDAAAVDHSKESLACSFSGPVVLNLYLTEQTQKKMSVDSVHSDVELWAEEGERWQFIVRLYPIRGFVNSGQSRYRMMQLADGVLARGYVRDNKQSLRLTPAGSLEKLQNTWVARFTTQATESGLPLVATLLTGQGEHLSSDQWLLLQETGTVHLVVVSGLHLGVLLGAGWFVVSFFRRLLPVDRYWQRLLLMTLPVVFLTPMLLIWPSGVAVTRALLMALLVLFLRAAGVYLSPFRILLLVVSLILIFQPFYLLRPGFYYSISAVALLLLLISGNRHYGLFLRIQLILMAGLLPMQHFWLNTPDLASGVVNLVAIPLVSLLILPLSLLGIMLPLPAVGALLTVVESVFWQTLAFGLDFGWGVADLSFGLQGGLLLLALIWALPALPGKFFALFALVAAFMIPADPAETQEEGFEVEILDVGQGLAVAVTVENHLMVYDTGPAFRSGFAPVAMILPPRLRSEGVRIDQLVVSHDDKDHAGGLGVLLPYSNEVLAGQPERITADNIRVSSCYRGQGWRWGDISFEVLYPPEELHSVRGISDNDRSCVLRIRSDREPEKSLLLTGDIDAQGEQWLLSSGQSLSAHWLIASHHGSAGGNSLAFLSAVAPKGVIYSAGHRNSYGHPAQKVQQRVSYLRSVQPSLYREYNTADLGAIRLTGNSEAGGWHLKGQRERIPQRWLWRKLH